MESISAKNYLSEMFGCTEIFSNFASEIVFLRTEKMKVLTKLVIGAFVLVGMVACASNSKGDRAEEQVPSASEQSIAPGQDYTDLVKSVYAKYVFMTDADSQVAPEEYFTANALKKLRDGYDYDCEDGDFYAFYALRTEAQDSKPGAEDVSEIISVEPSESDWYTVTYLDMGWNGKTRLKITDGKIDDYERCASEL